MSVDPLKEQAAACMRNRRFWLIARQSIAATAVCVRALLRARRVPPPSPVLRLYFVCLYVCLGRDHAPLELVACFGGERAYVNIPFYYTTSMIFAGAPVNKTVFRQLKTQKKINYSPVYCTEVDFFTYDICDVQYEDYSHSLQYIRFRNA